MDQASTSTQQSRRKPRRPWKRLALFLFLVAGIFAVRSCVPYVVSFKTLFEWSKPDLDAFAAKAMTPGSTALNNPPSHIGYFNVLKVEALPHGFLFQHDSCNPFDWCGLAYSTEPLPEEERSAGHVQICKPITGNWYDVFRQ